MAGIPTTITLSERSAKLLEKRQAEKKELLLVREQTMETLDQINLQYATIDGKEHGLVEALAEEAGIDYGKDVAAWSWDSTKRKLTFTFKPEEDKEDQNGTGPKLVAVEDKEGEPHAN